jgi:hypothetical protein
MELLRSAKWPKDSRAKVGIQGETKRGFVLGVVRRRDGRYALSKATRQHAELARYLTDLGSPVPFDAIQLNTGRCGLHVDSNNDGFSYLRTFGKHTGGELWIDGHVLAPLLVFDGKIPHMTMPYTSERISAIYYTTKKHKGVRPLSPRDREEAE